MELPIERQRVPRRALTISLGALAVPVAAAFWFPDWTSTGAGMLIWLAALIPAFLLSYYRGLAGVATALAGGMAVIVATQVSIAWFRIAEPDWKLLATVVGIYLGISVGIGVLAEIFRRDRRVAEELALIDRLTGLPNRRHADMVLEHEFAAARRGARIAVVLFDLDHFKAVNDRFGHPVGDSVLRDFGRVLAANTRKENLTARFGGEEFVSVLRDSTADDAVTFAQRVLDQLRDRTYPWGKVTASAGVAIYDPAMMSHEFLIGAADRALYRAKEGGRDTVALDAPRPARMVTPVPSVPAEPALAPLVWIVDDDAAVRSVIRRVLLTRKYRTWDTGDPEAAVHRIGVVNGDDRPAVLLSDVIMPAMTGPRMVDRIHAIAPGLPVIYMSGFVHGEVGQGDGVVSLQKPIAPDDLLNAVAKAAGGSGVLRRER